MPILVAGSKPRPHAEHGFTPVRRSAEHGFTLVELMIVVTIIGLASAAVALSLPDPRGRLGDEAARFALRARAAHDLAIVEARPVSLWVTPAGYGFEVRRDGTWQAISDKPLQVTKWSAGTQAATSVTGRDRVVFDSTGIADRPFDVRLLRDGEARDVHVGADGAVRVDG
ncbi:GspH/FimT family pseudopilin [Sphingomonas panacis]|nr:GspH/FimT family pseudopilin [Sphingomonas panacis]